MQIRSVTISWIQKYSIHFIFYLYWIHFIVIYLLSYFFSPIQRTKCITWCITCCYFWKCCWWSLEHLFRCWYFDSLSLRVAFRACFLISNITIENVFSKLWNSKFFSWKYEHWQMRIRKLLIFWSINTFTRDLFQCLVIIFICRTDVSKNCHSLLWKSS